MASHCKIYYVDFPNILKYLYFINIIAFDLGKSPRHHSALHTSKLAKNSAEDAVKAHLQAGMPASKLVLGMPFYGRGKRPYRDFTMYRNIKTTKGCS